MTNSVLILGASGKIGAHSAVAFKAAGWNVRLYDRKSDDMAAAAEGVDVIINGLNPPNYHNWAKLVPEITTQVIAAAKASGATVIIPGNVYNYGQKPGIWDENTPQNATSKKGRIRIEMEKTYRKSGVPTIVLRAGNFIDPDHNDDVMSLIFLQKLAKNKIVIPGEHSAMQAFCYVPDWAKAAVQLAEIRESLQQFEDVPFEGHAFTALELQANLQKTLNRPLKLVRFPWLVMVAAAPFWELARELNEMRYLWSTSHQLSSAKLKQLLPGFKPTPLISVLTAALPSNVHPNQSVPGSAVTSLV